MNIISGYNPLGIALTQAAMNIISGCHPVGDYPN